MSEKKKRTPQEFKLMAQIKKKLGYSVEPKTCTNCKLSTEDVPELFENDFELACEKFKELVTYGVEQNGSCTAHKRKPLKRVVKKEEETQSEGAPKPPTTKPSKKKKTKKSN